MIKIFTFPAVLLSSAAKILLFLLLLFYSLGVLAVVLQQPTGIDLVGTKIFEQPKVLQPCPFILTVTVPS